MCSFDTAYFNCVFEHNSTITTVAFAVIIIIQFRYLCYAVKTTIATIFKISIIICVSFQYYYVILTVSE